MVGLIVAIVIIVLLAIFVAGNYNSLVSLRNKDKDQWSQIDVNLKRRNDLIPTIVETVKGYAKHEKSTLEDVIKARNTFVSAKTPEEEMKAAGEITQAVSKLFALSEAYPELKADQNFMNLQNELKETEDKISYARQFYNDTVMTYNNKVQMFPSNIIAGMFNFKPELFFEADESERKNVEVKF